MDLLVQTCRRHYPGGPLGRIAHGTAYSNRFPARQRLRPSPYACKVGAHIGLFEACSTFTRVTACLLAASPEATHLSRRLRRFRYLHRRSDSYRLERPSYRVGIAPTEDQHLAGAHKRYVPVFPPCFPCFPCPSLFSLSIEFQRGQARSRTNDVDAHLGNPGRSFASGGIAHGEGESRGVLRTGAARSGATPGGLAAGQGGARLLRPIPPELGLPGFEEERVGPLPGRRPGGRGDAADPARCRLEQGEGDREGPGRRLRRPGPARTASGRRLAALELLRFLRFRPARGPELPRRDA